MYKKVSHAKSTIKTNNSTLGEPIEQAFERKMANGEPLKDGVTPLIYTERKEGVVAGYNIRTDRFEIALEASNSIHKSYITKRDERIKNKEEQTEKSKENAIEN